MKKSLIAILFASIFTIAAHAQISFGPEAGLNLSNIKEKISGVTVNGNTKAGVKLGFVIDNALGSGFYIQPALYFSSKGTVGQSDSKININYLELPLNVLYKFNTPAHNMVFLGAGGYAALAVSGQATSYGYSRKINIGNSVGNDVTTFDFGLGFQAGYQVRRGLFFRGQYQFGLSNINPEKSSSTSEGRVTNNAYSITAGWLFAGKHHSTKKKTVTKK